MRIFTLTLNASVDNVLRVEHFRAGEHLQAKVLWRQPAGKGVNVSRCLSSLGVESTAIAFVGHQELAQFERSFKNTLVQPRLIPLQQPTRVNITILDPESGQETHLREAGPTIEPFEMEVLNAELLDLLWPGDLLLICGSTPPGGTEREFSGLLRTARFAKARILLDSSGELLRVGLSFGVEYWKPNRRELEQALGRRLAETETLKNALLSLQGAGMVAVSLGEQGGMIRGGGAVYAGDCPAEEVVSTVGAGDAFVAGWVWGLSEGAAVDEYLRRALACGAAAVAEPVAGRINPEWVKRLLPRAQVRQVS